MFAALIVRKYNHTVDLQQLCGTDKELNELPVY